jgi:hypothetical protein
VEVIEGRGHGLIANKNIDANELILSENPFIWIPYLDSNSCNHNRLIRYCNDCGVHTSIDNNEFSCQCEKCHLLYCSTKCYNNAINSGHEWLCSSHLDGTITKLSENDTRGHIFVALMSYAKIVHQLNLNSTMFNTVLSIDIGQDLYDIEIEKQLEEHKHDMMTYAKLVMKGFMCSDYCRSIHAIRTGDLVPLDDNLFETFIAPIYYDNYLAIPMETYKDIFLNNSMWKTQYDHTHLDVLDATSIVNNNDKSTDISEKLYAPFYRAALNFIHSELFSPMFLRQLMGTFICNNHGIQVRGNNSNDITDNDIEAVSSSNINEHNTTIISSETSMLDNSSVVSGDINSNNHEILSDNHVLLGSGIYPTYSKMNHNCECNTYNGSKGYTVTIDIYAKRDIIAGNT